MVKKLSNHLPSSVGLGSGRLFTIGIEFGTMIYLMRQLGPEPFGLVAMVMSLIVILRILQDGGAGAFLVSDRGLNAERVGAALIVSLGFSVAAVLIALACTPLVAGFYNDSRVAEIWIIVSLLIVFSALSSVPISIAQKEQCFFLVSWIPALAHLAAGISAIALSLTRNDFWPIIIYHVVVSMLTLTISWLAVRPKASLPQKNDLKDVFHFSKGLFVFEFLNVLNRNADDILIGRVLGSQALGLYGFAYRMLSLPLRRIGGMVSTLAYPRLSKLVPDWKAVGHGLAEVMREVALFATPVCIGVALSAQELIHVTVGDEWQGALIPLQVFAVLGIYQTPFSMLGLAYLVSKNTSQMAKWAFISTPVIILSFFVGLPWGIEGVAFAYSLATLALFWPMVKMAASVLHVDPWMLLKGAITGIATGLVISIPVAMVCTITSLLGADAIVILSSTICVGVITEMILYVWIIRHRRRNGAKW